MTSHTDLELYGFDVNYVPAISKYSITCISLMKKTAVVGLTPKHWDSHVPGLARSCCEVMTPQRYRYTGAVGSHLNYPRTEYGAPTGSNARDRASTKTHFESRLHVDPAMFTNHMCDTEFRAGP